MKADDFENQLRAMELRRPPAEWRALLVPRPVWLPMPLAIGLASCWVATAGFMLATPRDEAPDFPPLPEGAPGWSPRGIEDGFLLGFYEPEGGK